ncbi:MAG TPA: BatA domain-containing protein [Gemmatimonadales bacterium]|nr:BatA domain-containing protein [Gemmatimonadales bacterium]
MIFLHPLALFGLAAAAIPALLHLRQRRTPPVLDFPAVRYLADAERRTAKRLRLRHLLLLILRTLLIAAVVMAAARPQVRGWGRATGHEPTAAVIVLDNSLSSGVVIDGRRVLDGLVATAHGVTARAGSGDRLWLLLADGVVRRGTPAELDAAIDDARPEAGRMDLSDAVRRAVAVAASASLPVHEVYVISDGQASALSGPPVRPGSVRVIALEPRTGPVPNRGVGELRLVDARLLVPVVGTPGGKSGTLTVTYRHRVISRGLAAPGDTLAIALPVAPVGWWTGAVDLEADELRGDDRRLFVQRVHPPARVTAAASAGPFVNAALDVLREAERIADGNDVTIATLPTGRFAVVPATGDPASVGAVNRALGLRGGHWRFGVPATPGRVSVRGAALSGLEGVPVGRRLELTGGDPAGILATVNGAPWLVRDGSTLLIGSALDTSWTTLPATPSFVPFVDALVNVLAQGEAPVSDTVGAPGVQFRINGRDTVGALVAGPDARESDLTPAPAALFSRALGAEAYASSSFADAAFAGSARGDAGGLLLILALAFLAGEWIVAMTTR